MPVRAAIGIWSLPSVDTDVNHHRGIAVSRKIEFRPFLDKKTVPVREAIAIWSLPSVDTDVNHHRGIAVSRTSKFRSLLDENRVQQWTSPIFRVVIPMPNVIEGYIPPKERNQVTSG